MQGKAIPTLILAALTLSIAGGRIIAQSADSPAKPIPAPGAKDAKDRKPVADEKKKSEEVIGRADYMKSAWGGKKTVLMKGNVKFTHGDTVLTSDQVDYDQDAKVAVSPGKVVITNPECDITGDKGSAFFKKRLGIIEGSVVMQVKPKQTEQDAAADKENVRAKLSKPTTVTCARLEYQYREKIATALGGVVLKQEKRTASADKLIYDEKNELLTLIGNVKGTDENNQTFAAPGKVTISVKKGDEWMEAEKASATFKVDVDEENTEESKP